MIDTVRIHELRSEIGRDDLASIVSVYFDEAGMTLRKVASGTSPEDYARAVHFLRSGALNIGLRGIATLASQIEGDPAQNTGTTQAARIAELEEALRRSKAELDAALS